jgi:hypothetical protein
MKHADLLDCCRFWCPHSERFIESRGSVCGVVQRLHSSLKSSMSSSKSQEMDMNDIENWFCGSRKYNQIVSTVNAGGLGVQRPSDPLNTGSKTKSYLGGVLPLAKSTRMIDDRAQALCRLQVPRRPQLSLQPVAPFARRFLSWHYQGRYLHWHRSKV